MKKTTFILLIIAAALSYISTQLNVMMLNHEVSTLKIKIVGLESDDKFNSHNLDTNTALLTDIKLSCFKDNESLANKK